MTQPNHRGDTRVVSVEPQGTLPPVRRIVTGHREDGRSVILSDGPAPCRSAPPAMPQLVATVLWTTDRTPASLGGEEETAPAGRVPPMAPPANGTILRIADFPPDSAYDGVDMDQLFSEVGGKHHQEAAGEDDDGRHGWFHKTPTLDYAIVLDGEVWALLDQDETLTRTGDVLIQRGTNHAWANRSDRPCRMAFVLIDGHDLPARDALTEHLISLVEQYAGPQGGPVAQIIAECQYDEGTLHEFRERFWDGRRAATRALVARAIREGDLRDGLEPELMVELVYSAVYVRLLVRLPRARPRVRRADHRDGDGGNRRADRGVTVPDRVARLIAEAHWYRTGAASGVRTAARSTQDRV